MLSNMSMTDEHRKSVILDYFRAFDNGGVTPDGRNIMELFAEDAQVCFPKWGIATGLAQISVMFADLGERLTMLISIGCFPARLSLSVKAPATASMWTARGVLAIRIGQLGIGAMFSKSATGKSIDVLSTLIPTTEGRTFCALHGWGSPFEA